VRRQHGGERADAVARAEFSHAQIPRLVVDPRDTAPRAEVQLWVRVRVRVRLGLGLGLWLGLRLGLGLGLEFGLGLAR
jgi:hypothetical protein